MYWSPYNTPIKINSGHVWCVSLKSKVHYHHGRKTQITHYFFFVAKVRNIRYTAETEDLVLRQRSGWLFRYSLVISKIQSGITPTNWSNIDIHSLFPSRQLSLAPPRESQPYLQNESCFEFLRSSTHSLIDPISVVGYVRVDARQLCASTSDPPRHQPDQRAFAILEQEYGCR